MTLSEKAGRRAEVSKDVVAVFGGRLDACWSKLGGKLNVC